ncbi:hypothetical protein [Shigella boydii]|nr:hypothetical protein [Shigella boydii]
MSSCATNADRVAFKRESLLPRWMPTIEAWLQSGEEYKYIRLPGASLAV